MSFPSAADLLHLRKLTDRCPVAMLTTLGCDRNLVSRPMVPLEMDAQGSFWFFTDWRHVEIDHLGSANLSFADPVRGPCVSITGRSEIHVDRARIARLRSRSTRLPDAQGEGAWNLALLKFVSLHAEVWDMPREHVRRMSDLSESQKAARFIRFAATTQRPAQPHRAPTHTAFGTLMARAAFAWTRQGRDLARAA